MHLAAPATLCSPPSLMYWPTQDQTVCDAIASLCIWHGAGENTLADRWAMLMSSAERAALAGSHVTCWRLNAWLCEV
jgi:hypothetical protein